MSDMIPSWLPRYQEKIDFALENFFTTRYEKQSSDIESTYEESIRYAVEGGGKRLRPILALLAYEQTSDNDSSVILPYIIGIEFIHCYTLVHDDLPCIDDDDLRRGKPSVWKKYGEGMAVLVGDTLQTLGFETMASSWNILAVKELTSAVGDMGVARGQVRDTFLRQDSLSLAELLRIHDEKTGSFIAACLVIGARLAGGDEDTIGDFRRFGFLLGRAFQIRDDILDYEWTAETLGKETGKDVALGKGIVALVGIEKSKALLSELEQEMQPFLGIFSDEKFRDVVDFVVHRVK